MQTDKWTEDETSVIEQQTINDATTLASPEVFSDERADARLRADCGLRGEQPEIGPKSGAVAARLTRSCAGWTKPPTAQEFFAAIRARELTKRQRHLIATWLFEATNEDIIQAWLEEAYSFRELVRAIHNAGAEGDYPERNRELNQFAGL